MAKKALKQLKETVRDKKTVRLNDMLRIEN